jgi:hypothetical protein
MTPITQTLGGSVFSLDDAAHALGLSVPELLAARVPRVVVGRGVFFVEDDLRWFAQNSNRDREGKWKNK